MALGFFIDATGKLLACLYFVDNPQTSVIVVTLYRRGNSLI
jgi:hypothetical protein